MNVCLHIEIIKEFSSSTRIELFAHDPLIIIANNIKERLRCIGIVMSK